MKPLTSEWAEKAEGDFRTANREAVASPDPNYDNAVYHAQQCVEKYLKARLIEAGILFRRTHCAHRMRWKDDTSGVRYSGSLLVARDEGGQSMGDHLVEMLVAGMGTRWWDREDIIQATARYLGFRRTGPVILDCLKLAVNGAIRRGLLEYEGNKVRKTYQSTSHAGKTSRTAPELGRICWPFACGN